MFAYAAVMGNDQVWKATAVLCVWTVAAISLTTLAIGCLVMLPIAVWRLLERMAARRRRGWSPVRTYGTSRSTARSGESGS